MHKAGGRVCRETAFDRYSFAGKHFLQGIAMEELHRLHKDVPFGWLLWAQQLFRRRSQRTIPISRKAPIGRGLRA
jgi:hypothetical protein